MYVADPRSLGRILRIPLDGSDVRALASELPMPQGLAIDDTHVYWTNWADGSARAGAGALMKVAKTGGPPTTLATSQRGPHGIAPDETHVYWALFVGGEIRRIPKQGGPEEVLVSNERNPRSVAVDGSSVYWGNFGMGDTTIKKVDKTGGGVTPLADAGGSPVDVTIDDARVYWISYGSRAVWSVGKDGGVPTSIAPGGQSPGAAGSHGLGVDGAHVYWLNSRAISRAPKNGGAAEVLFTGSELGGLAVAPSAIYFGMGPDMMRLEKTP